MDRATWETLSLDEKRALRASAWIVNGAIGPDYPYWRDPEFIDLAGPPQLVAPAAAFGVEPSTPASDAWERGAPQPQPRRGKKRAA